MTTQTLTSLWKAPKSYSGVLIAIFLPFDIGAQIVDVDGEPLNELHVTLSYFASDWRHIDTTAIRKTLKNLVDDWDPIEVEIQGVAQFVPKDTGGPVPNVMLMNSPTLQEFQHHLVDALIADGTAPEQEFGFVPHITIRFDGPPIPLPKERLSFTVDTITLAYAGDRIQYPLGKITKEGAGHEFHGNQWHGETAAALNSGARSLPKTPEGKLLREGIKSWTGEGEHSAKGTDMLKETIAHAPHNAPELWRGVRSGLTPTHPEAGAVAHVAELKQVGNVVSLGEGGPNTAQLASFSTDQNVAMGFAGATQYGGESGFERIPRDEVASPAVLIRVEPGSQALRIDRISQSFKAQAEWVSTGQYRVTNVEDHPTVKGLSIVTLQQVDAKKTFAPTLTKEEAGHEFHGNQWNGGGGKTPSFSELKGMEKISGPKGSQGGQWYRDSAGKEYLVKPGQSESHVQNEVAAGIVYREAGVKFPNTGIAHDDNGKPLIVSEKIDGLKQLSASQWKSSPDLQAEAAKNFGLDTMLSHWDVHGLSADNTLVDKAGDPVRIESGGAMQYRGMGGDKGAAFSADGKWDYAGMRTSDQGRLMYGKMSDSAAADSLERAASLNVGDIKQKWTDAGVSQANADKWGGVLESRQAQIPGIVAALRS